MSDNRRERFFQYAYGNDRFYQEAAQTLLGWAGVTVERPVLFSNGGQNALTAILAALFRPGDRIGVDPLVYPGLKVRPNSSASASSPSDRRMGK